MEVNLSIYLNKEEAEFFKGYPKGWLKELIRAEMKKGLPVRADPVKQTPDTFGPRLKR